MRSRRWEGNEINCLPFCSPDCSEMWWLHVASLETSCAPEQPDMFCCKAVASLCLLFHPSSASLVLPSSFPLLPNRILAQKGLPQDPFSEVSNSKGPPSNFLLCPLQTCSWQFLPGFIAVASKGCWDYLLPFYSGKCKDI